MYTFWDVFAATRVEYNDDGPTEIERRLFWLCLGYRDNTKFMTHLLYVNPRWDARRSILTVSVVLQHDVDGLKVVKDAMKFVFRWRNWSDTRMAAMARSGQSYIASKALGLDYLVQLVKDSKGSSNCKYYTSSTSKATPEVQKLFAVAAMSVYPLDQFLLEILEDDRWNLERFAALPMSFWNQLAALVLGANASDIRFSTIGSMHLGLGHWDCNAYALLRSTPLALTQGGIEENVDCS